jgi:predicted component of type VI protein secretion system
MSVFRRLPQQTKKPFALSLREIREIVVKDFSNLLDELHDEARVNVPRKRQRKILQGQQRPMLFRQLGGTEKR